MKIPKTKAPADMKLPPVLAKPKPVNIATKERIVIGFVSVKKTSRHKRQLGHFLWTKPRVSHGFAKRVLTPK